MVCYKLYNLLSLSRIQFYDFLSHTTVHGGMMLKKTKKGFKLVSKKNPKKVLKNFGKDKPSKEEVAKEEARVNFFKEGGVLNKKK
ncbi:hypothetical protein LAh8_120 [Aeromonas phage LAh_8]|uniref:Uncharacterized protein n=3 Tax=Lahexavirus TaxID=2843411 RepID=A0A513ZZY7_9CAUD|nr:hypothetical protein HWC30_gp078 [Aeromonas phage LAh_6]YP_009847459.1 hypothetical protein HWC31_gp121 [Aeromonas phage LAh_8]QDH46584.1 hypothetical protein LAh6_78 [Aeromonas phage LAh_6]QDH46818.1 hypothetical protein LAh8_120 [Aeromonas phage LAh_8]